MTRLSAVQIMYNAMVVCVQFIFVKIVSFKVKVLCSEQQILAKSYCLC